MIYYVCIIEKAMKKRRFCDSSRFRDRSPSAESDGGSAEFAFHFGASGLPAFAALRQESPTCVGNLGGTAEILRPIAGTGVFLFAFSLGRRCQPAADGWGVYNAPRAVALSGAKRHLSPQRGENKSEK